MLNIALFILGTAIIIWFIRDTWFPNLENIYRKNYKKLEKNTWETIDSLKKSPDYGNKEKAIKYYQKRLQDFEKAYINYLHLEERYRHDSKINQIKKDWKFYLDSVGKINKFNEEYDAYGMYSDANVVDELRSREDKAEIIIGEIEKRFDKYLK